MSCFSRSTIKTSNFLIWTFSMLLTCQLHWNYSSTRFPCYAHSFNLKLKQLFTRPLSLKLNSKSQDDSSLCSHRFMTSSLTRCSLLWQQGIDSREKQIRGICVFEKTNWRGWHGWFKRIWRKRTLTGVQHWYFCFAWFQRPDPTFAWSHEM